MYFLFYLLIITKKINIEVVVIHRKWLHNNNNNNYIYIYITLLLLTNSQNNLDKLFIKSIDNYCVYAIVVKSGEVAERLKATVVTNRVGSVRTEEGASAYPRFESLSFRFLVAQLVEQAVVTRSVGGSSPSQGANQISW